MPTLNEGVFSSDRPDWETPFSLFHLYDAAYHFTVDVCAQPHNFKVVRFFSPETNGLVQSWAGERCWMNPPYGDEIVEWVQKAATESLFMDTLIVALLPARTDTEWFYKYVAPYAALDFLVGRVKFVGAPTGAPFPSVVATYGLGHRKVQWRDWKREAAGQLTLF